MRNQRRRIQPAVGHAGAVLPRSSDPRSSEQTLSDSRCPAPRGPDRTDRGRSCTIPERRAPSDRNPRAAAASPATPTSTMRPRFRLIAAAACTGPSSSLASVSSTASAPSSAVRSSTARATSTPSAAATARAPNRSASASRDASRSIPITSTAVRARELDRQQPNESQPVHDDRLA